MYFGVSKMTADYSISHLSGAYYDEPSFGRAIALQMIQELIDLNEIERLNNMLLELGNETNSVGFLTVFLVGTLHVKSRLSNRTKIYEQAKAQLDAKHKKAERELAGLK